MDKILKAADDIRVAYNVELRLKGRANEQVITILKELVEEKFTSTNIPVASASQIADAMVRVCGCIKQDYTLDELADVIMGWSRQLRNR